MSNICQKCNDGPWPAPYIYCPGCGHGLKGVQGPEQGIVGESRSGSPTCQAEEAKPGERGVGEIVERDELLRHIEERFNEEHRLVNVGHGEGDMKKVIYQRGKRDALRELREWLSDTAEKRSDLSNAATHAPGADEKPLK